MYMPPASAVCVSDRELAAVSQACVGHSEIFSRKARIIASLDVAAGGCVGASLPSGDVGHDGGLSVCLPACLFVGLAVIMIET